MKPWRVRTTIKYKSGRTGNIFTFKNFTISIHERSYGVDIMYTPHKDGEKYFIGLGDNISEAMKDLRRELSEYRKNL